MNWLRELSRIHSGQAFLTAVEDRLYQRCEGQARRPAREAVHWTLRARNLIGGQGLSHRLRVGCEGTHAPASAVSDFLSHGG